ncbi:hypothetical protein V8E54_000806, partial [Elaphomyces granulatus]
LNYNPVTEVLRIKFMTTEIHEAHARWMATEWQLMAATGWFTVTARLLLRVLTTHISNIIQQTKCISIIRQHKNMFSTWNNSVVLIRKDKDLWLVGGAPDVEVVILLNWTKLSRGRVKGVIQNSKCFPAAGNPVIRLTRGEIFGNALLPNRHDANDVWNLDVSRLRIKAREKLAAT